MEFVKTMGHDTVLKIEIGEMSILAGCLMAIGQQFDDLDPGILRMSREEFTKVHDEFFEVLRKSNDECYEKKDLPVRFP